MPEKSLSACEQMKFMQHYYSLIHFFSLFSSQAKIKHTQNYIFIVHIVFSNDNTVTNMGSFISERNVLQLHILTSEVGHKVEQRTAITWTDGGVET